jgi:hypothetical protein
MAHVLLVATGEFRDPVAGVVLMKSDDSRGCHILLLPFTRASTRTTK